MVAILLVLLLITADLVIVYQRREFVGKHPAIPCIIDAFQCNGRSFVDIVAERDSCKECSDSYQRTEDHLKEHCSTLLMERA